MISMSLKEIAWACGGALADADPDAVPSVVTIDSRLATDGALFVALAGMHADGHDYVADARARGAIVALVQRKVDGPRIVVPEVQRALTDLAREVRDRSAATTVAITGSSGKTATKDLTAAALGASRSVVASPGNFNNEIGVPLAILGARDDTAALVVEVGADAPGDIAALMPVVRPQVGVVTNVGPAHIGRFGSLDAIQRTKAELVDALPDDGWAVLNADDPRVAAMADRTGAQIVTYGRGAGAGVRAEDVTSDERGRASFTAVVGEQRIPVRLSMAGEHMVANALAALGVAAALDAPLESAGAAIADCVGSPGRMTIIESGARLIVDDSYNANPDSMAAALRALIAIGGGRPTWAVLGHMAELGEYSPVEHDRIGRLAARLGVGTLVVVGPEALAIQEAARLEGMAAGASHAVEDADEAVVLLAGALEPDAVVLVKASRAAGLERIVTALREDA